MSEVKELDFDLAARSDININSIKKLVVRVRRKAVDREVASIDLPDELFKVTWQCADCGRSLSMAWLRGSDLQAVGHRTCGCGARYSGRFGISSVRRLAKRSRMSQSTARYYVYLGDSFTRLDLRGARCRAVLRPDGKCVCSGTVRDDRPGHEGRLWNQSTMLVEFEGGERVVVLRRRLRKVEGIDGRTPGAGGPGGDVGAVGVGR